MILNDGGGGPSTSRTITSPSAEAARSAAQDRARRSTPPPQALRAWDPNPRRALPVDTGPRPAWLQTPLTRQGQTLSHEMWGRIRDAAAAARVPVNVQQGSWAPGNDPTSVGTHDEGGAVDLFVNGMSRDQQLNFIQELRRRNIAAWLRTQEFGWPNADDPHIHGIQMDAPGLSKVAQNQVAAYRSGLNGLANRAPDPHRQPKPARLKKPSIPASTPVQDNLPQRNAPALLRLPVPRQVAPISEEGPSPPVAQYSSPSAEWAQFGNPLMTVPVLRDYRPGPAYTSPSAEAAVANWAANFTAPQPGLLPPPAEYTSPSAEWAQFGNPLMTMPVLRDYRPGPSYTSPSAEAAVANWTANFTVPQPGLLPPPAEYTSPSAEWAQSQAAPAITVPQQVAPFEGPAPAVQITSPTAEWAQSQGTPTAYTSPSVEWNQNRVPTKIKIPRWLTKDSFSRTKKLLAHEYKLSDPEVERLRGLGQEVEDPNVSSQLNAKVLTWEAYDALPVQERAAVDFNTLLVEARQKDLRVKPPMSADEWTQYGKDVRSIFGEQGNSRVVAPNTVALLKRLGLEAKGQDLDEFLSLDRAFNMREMANFKFSDDQIATLDEFMRKPVTAPGTNQYENYSPYVTGLNPTAVTNTSSGPYPVAQMDPNFVPVDRAAEEYANVRTAANLNAIDTSLVQSALDLYKDRLTGFGDKAWDIRAALGINADKPTVPGRAPVGYGRGVENGTPSQQYAYQLDLAVEDLYNMLRANPNNKGKQAVFEDLANFSWTAEEQQHLWDYLDRRTRQEVQYLDDQDAQRIRDILGWE